MSLINVKYERSTDDILKIMCNDPSDVIMGN